MVIVGCACNFRVIVAHLRKEAGDFDNGSHGDGAGVGVEGSRWLLVGASVGAAVGDRAVLSVVDLVVWRPESKRRQDIGWSHRLGNQSVGASEAHDIGTWVGFGQDWSETRLVKRRCKRCRDLSWSKPQTQTASGYWRQCGLIGIRT